MIERYGKAGKKIELKNECAESVDYGDKTFDLIFTSPYFNIERYSKRRPILEETQKVRKLVGIISF